MLIRPSQYGSLRLGDLYVAGIDGSDIQLIAGDIGTHSDPVWSPDGSRIAFYSRRVDGEGIYVANPDGTDLQLLSAPWAIDWSPTWSPDGEWIAFTSSQSRKDHDIFIMRADGSELANLTAD